MSVPAIGIDLGTTHCCLAVYQNGRVKIIPDDDSGESTIPSYVYIGADGEEVVGKQAKESAFKNPDNTIFDVKRILGRTITDPELENDMKFWPFKVQEENGVPMVVVNGEPYYPEQISAKILAKLKSTAEGFLGLDPGSVKKAVITVPAYFSDGQRQATVDAGELAGLEVLTILNEPTAAAIAFSVENKDDGKTKKILVFDLGGGTFDIAVMDIQPKNLAVLGVNGDTHLGGEDFDKLLMEHCAAIFKAETGIDMMEGKDSTNNRISSKAKRNLRRLQTYCEQAKKYLTSGVKAKISVDALFDGHDLVLTVTREQFETLNRVQFKKTVDLVDATLKELGLSKNDIDEVVLVGGSTRIPKIQQLLSEYFTGKILNKSVHPDQAVAYGAAVQAAIMTGETSLGELKFDKIQDVTPMALGAEVVSKRLAVIIPKNTKVPTKKTSGHVTVNENQTAITFKIYQGNDLDVAANNRLLGTFDLEGIPAKKAGEEPVDVTMEINKMGILHVEAVLRSDKKKSSSITVVENKKRMSAETKKKLLADMNR